MNLSVNEPLNSLGVMRIELPCQAYLKTLLVIFFTAFFFQLYGQIETFEDYNQCLIGFRRTYNKEIVVEPKYERVDLLFQSNAYIGFLEDKLFVLNDQGKVIERFNGLQSYSKYSNQIYLKYTDSTIVLNEFLELVYRTKAALRLVSSSINPLLCMEEGELGTRVLNERFEFLFEVNGSNVMYCDAYHENNKEKAFIPFQPEGSRVKRPVFLRFIRDGKIGVVDMTGKEVIAPEYNYLASAPLLSHQNELFEFWLAKKEDYIGIIDTAKNFIPMVRDKYFWNHFKLNIFPLYCGNEMAMNRLFATFSYLGGHYLYDLNKGKKIKGGWYDWLEPGCGIIHFKKGNKIGMFNSDGQIVNVEKTDGYLKQPVNYFSRLESNNGKNIINTSISPDLYLHQLNPYLGKTGRVGLINHIGKKLTEPFYYKFIFADKEGKEVIWGFRKNPEEWKSREMFIDLINIKTGGTEEIYRMDKSFNPYLFQQLLTGQKDKLFLKLWTGKFVLVDKVGKKLSKEFDDFAGMMKTQIKKEGEKSYQLNYLLKDGKWGSLNENLQTVIPFEYDSIQQNFLAGGKLFYSADRNFFQSEDGSLEIEGDAFDFLYKEQFTGHIQRLNNLISNSSRKVFLLIIKSNKGYVANYKGELIPVAQLISDPKNKLVQWGRYLFNRDSDIVYTHFQSITKKHNYAFIIDPKANFQLYNVRNGSLKIIDSVSLLRHDNTEGILFIQHINGRFSAFDMNNDDWLVRNPVEAIIVNIPRNSNHITEREVWIRTMPMENQKKHTQNWTLYNEEWLMKTSGIDYPFYSHFYSSYDERHKQYHNRETSYFPFSKNDRYNLMLKNGDSVTSFNFTSYYPNIESPFFWFQNGKNISAVSPINGKKLGTYYKPVLAPLYNDKFIVYFDSLKRLSIQQAGDTNLILKSKMRYEEFLKIKWGKDFYWISKSSKAVIGNSDEYYDSGKVDSIYGFPFTTLLKEFCPYCVDTVFMNKVLWDYFENGVTPLDYVNGRTETGALYVGSAAKPGSINSNYVKSAKELDFKVLFSDSLILTQKFVWKKNGRSDVQTKSFYLNEGTIDTLHYADFFVAYTETLQLLTRNYLVSKINEQQLYGKSCPNIEQVISYMMNNIVILSDGLYFIPEKFKYSENYWVKLENTELLSMMKTEMSTYLEGLNLPASKNNTYDQHYHNSYLVPVERFMPDNFEYKIDN